MARPRKARTLHSLPAPVIYIPAGWTEAQPSPVEVAIEDFEIMRLVDGHGYRIEEAAQALNVSRSTAGRMIERARRALALGIEQRAPIYLDASEDLVLEAEATVRLDNTTPTDATGAGLLAIACTEHTPDAAVERIFGRSPSFLLVSGEKGVPPWMVDNPGTALKRQAAPAAVEQLRAHGVTRVVAGRFGPDAVEALAKAGIQAFVANGFRVRQAIELFINHTQS
jgi:predicted DNA-binding protein (UPF0251 family)/predicted Fe-Mo cluster-binding NifX family protein